MTAGIHAGGGAEGLAEDSTSIDKAFVNEELVYNIGLWIFDSVAVGKVNLRKGQDNDFVATLEAYTTGTIDRYIQHRKDRYVSRMRLAENGKRFFTVSFEKTVDINGRIKRSLTVLDYDKRIMSWKGWEGDKEVKSGELALPDNIRYFDDPIASFYNFRFGVYGSIEEGKEYRIYTFPKKDHVPFIYLKVESRDEMERMTEKMNIHSDYLANAILDKELFGSKKGNIDVYFTKNMLPVEAVAKDVLFFGDVRGVLDSVGVVK